MNAPAFTPDLAPAWTSLDLLSHLWQSTAVALAVLILLLVCRTSIPARTRRLLCWLALAKFAVPLTLFRGYELSLGRFERWFVPQADSGVPDAAAVAAVTSGAIDSPGAAGIAAAVAPTAAVESAGLTAWEWMVAIWIVGAVLVISSWILRAITVRRRILAEAGPLSSYVKWHLKVAARRVGLKQTPDGVAVADDFAPAVVGLLSPVVILPRGLESDLAPAELHSVLLHELVHVQRRDSFSSALQTFIVGVLWFNPVVWLISQMIHLESEKSCDERVLQLTGDPDAYAGGILKCVRRALGLPQPVYPSVANPPITSRIHAILSHGTKPERRFAGRLAVAAALVFASLGGLAGTFAASAQLPALPPTEPVRAGAVLTPLVTSGDKITVDFADTEMRNIITSVGDLFNLNVEMPAVLPGRVSVGFRDAGWREIYTSVLKPAGYSFIEQGNVVRIIPIPVPQPVALPAAPPVTSNRVNFGGEIFDPSKLDRMPVASLQIKPEFPFEMRREGTNGSVTVEFIVDANGNVPAAWAVKSTVKDFEKNAVAAVQRWKFQPGMKGGRAVITHMNVDIRFNTGDVEIPVDLPALAAPSAPGPSGALPIRAESVVATVDRIEPSFVSHIADAPAPVTEAPAAPAPVPAVAVAATTADGTEAVPPSVDSTPGGTASVPSIPAPIATIQAPDEAPVVAEAEPLSEAPAEAAPAATPAPRRSPGYVTSSAVIRNLANGVTQFLAKDGSEIFTLQPSGVLVLGNQIYESSRLTESPRPKLQFKPDYPADMRKLGVSGKVSVDFVVDPKGDVIAAWARSSTRPVFEPSAIAAVLRWKFNPAKADGKPVASHLFVDVVFNLNDSRFASN